jgi:hypothetical protein
MRVSRLFSALGMFLFSVQSAEMKTTVLPSSQGPLKMVDTMSFFPLMYSTNTRLNSKEQSIWVRQANLTF